MQVRCTARVAPSWREGSEAVVGNSQLADSKEAMLLGKAYIFCKKKHIFS